MPGLKNLFEYQRDWLGPDIKAGLSVSAVALPIAIAYAELTGVSPIVGLYACILPMIAYALFGSSRQLIIGPDAATCAIIAAVVAPLALSNPQVYLQLVIIMTFMTGIWCLIASKLHLGALADLLSRPILTGLLNGVAITIIIGQLNKVLGYTSNSNQLIEILYNLPVEIQTIHWPSFISSALTLALLILFRRFFSKLPAPLIVMVIMTFLAAFLAEQFNIDMIGEVRKSSSLPDFSNFPPGLLRELLVPSLNLALVSFVSLMLTARSFATKNRYEIDANAEFRALGIANILSAISQGFAVSGASSRTAVNDNVGGKTQLVSIIAAAVIAFVLFFMTAPLKYIPISSLGVVLIYATWSLIDFKNIRKLRKRDKAAFRLAIFTVVMVLTVGVIAGIGLAVLVGLMQFLRIIFRPTESLLGADEEGRIHSLSSNKEVKPIENTIIYRFNSPLTYFNIAYFKRRINQLVENSDGLESTEIKWVIIDAVSALTHSDVSVIAGLKELKKELNIKGIQILFAGRKTNLTQWLRVKETNKDWLLFNDLYLAVRYVQSITQIDEENQIENSDSNSTINTQETIRNKVEIDKNAPIISLSHYNALKPI